MRLFEWFYKKRHEDSVIGFILKIVYFIFSFGCIYSIFFGFRHFFSSDLIGRILSIVCGIIGCVFFFCLWLGYTTEQDEELMKEKDQDLERLMCEYIRYKDIAEHEKGNFDYPNGKEPRFLTITHSDYRADYYALEDKVRKYLYP